MNDSQDLLISSYHTWLRERVSTEVMDNRTTELTTPFLDRHNDYIQVYAEQESSGSYLLTDDGYIISELRSSGVESRGTRREELFHRLLAGYGITLKGSELQTRATNNDLGQRLHSLIQAMLSIDDMFVLSQPTIEKLFIEDVAKFLDDCDIRYTPAAKFAGKSGLDHLVDFVIPKSKTAPERFLHVVNSPRRDRIENILFAINDTREARRGDTSSLALINDTKREVSTETIEAFKRYDVVAQPWSDREELVETLAA
ncbi:DUF1828 domain-containing protein [Amycolatopsis sp. cmx-4-61]|uniref:DUF1828 domain-containing protein n=1 Tax=Amycolatopsis sp. cmx-4-61 TaxID=2790937 RepID=UPI003978ACC5